MIEKVNTEEDEVSYFQEKDVLKTNWGKRGIL